MKRQDLTVIKGGKEDSYIYVSGYVTDTRLMGVMCMYINWIVNGEEELHQFFYFETEEDGFDDYVGINTYDVHAISLVEMQMAGNLGGRKKDISEDEALFLFNKYVRFNREHGIPLPEGKGEYSFMIGRGRELTEEETKQFNACICTEIQNGYEAVNYFLMRCFGLDYEGAEMIMTGDHEISGFEEFGISVLCKNTIDNTSFEDIYRCESVIETDKGYMIVISEIGLDGTCVDGVRIISSMKISDAEAVGILSKSEYVTVYDTDGNDQRIENMLITVLRSAAVTPFEGGDCYTEYNVNNEHVRRRVYWLNEDVNGVYYLTHGGQLVIGAYHEDNIEKMEDMLERSILNSSLRTAGRYEFTEHIIYEFIQSGYDNFQEFLGDTIGGEFV